MKLKYERETEPIKEQDTGNPWKFYTPAKPFTDQNLNRMLRQYIEMAVRPVYVNFPAPADVWEVNPEPLQGN